MGEKMSNCKASCSVLLVFFIVGLCSVCQYSAAQVDANQTANLIINASISRPIPETLFGIFFEEINHAGAGGIWAELVSNRGFEAGGQNTPSNIAPWSIIGDQSSLTVSTDRSSCFERNKVALQMNVLCDSKGSNICPAGGVGVYNPGFWGMNIEQGKVYKVVLFVRSLGSINVSVSLTSSDGSKMLATANILDSDVSNWTKVEVLLEATGTNPNSRLQLTTSRKGVIWFDQVSAMPVDTYKGHGFRNELIEMLDDIKPQFIRFPGGCFIEGEWLRNAFSLEGKHWTHGRRDPGTLVMFGCIGLMMDLDTSSFFNLLKILVHGQYGCSTMESAIRIKLIRLQSCLLYKKPLMVSSLLEAILILSGVLSEPQWGIQNLLT
ncbi:hypothetical protein OIU77_018090 [Salix suchowensis]|uniref:Uncharacterized protein n=1 Tax=Salix suchowensis TaxID=1278906 RepID=A0ABQ8ZR75_9ROSI|nr:hypothetical protein OIU77_018090 [Salix suchowensis]